MQLLIMSSHSLVVSTAVRGYHFYQTVWVPVDGEVFVSLHEADNSSDSHAMGVYLESNPGVIVGHLPREISRYCHYFTMHEGKINGEVSGPRRYSQTLEKGGMEIPCLLTFSGRARNIRRLREHFEGLPSNSVLVLSSSA